MCRSKRMQSNCLEENRQGRDGLSWPKVPMCTDRGLEMQNSLSSRNEGKFLVLWNYQIVKELCMAY